MKSAAKMTKQGRTRILYLFWECSKPIFKPLQFQMIHAPFLTHLTSKLTIEAASNIIWKKERFSCPISITMFLTLGTTKSWIVLLSFAKTSRILLSVRTWQPKFQRLAGLLKQHKTTYQPCSLKKSQKNFQIQQLD